jgi:hypothetical protein
MKILVVIEMILTAAERVPKEIHFVVVDDPTDHELAVLELATGKHFDIKSEDTLAIKTIRGWVYGEWSNEKHALVPGKWSDKKTTTISPVINGPFDNVYFCGRYHNH